MREQRFNMETLAGGALAERVNEALMDAVVNMMNPATSAKKKRRVNIAIDLVPDENRRIAGMSISVTTKLVPHEPAKTNLLMDVSQSGELDVREYGDQIPGQINFEDIGALDGEESATIKNRKQGPVGFDAATGEIFESEGHGNVVSIEHTAAQ